jgi:hypothetical protein
MMVRPEAAVRFVAHAVLCGFATGQINNQTPKSNTMALKNPTVVRLRITRRVVMSRLSIAFPLLVSLQPRVLGSSVAQIPDGIGQLPLSFVVQPNNSLNPRLAARDGRFEFGDPGAQLT